MYIRNVSEGAFGVHVGKQLTSAMVSNDIAHESTNDTSKPNWDLKAPEESSGHDYVRKSLVWRLRKDTAFRYKIKRSTAVMWSIFLVGWLKGLIGPSFPEILFLTNTPLERGSVYLTVMYTCKILGNALGGLLYDKIDKDLYSTVLPVINALVLLVLPWCRTYETMIIMFGIHGLMISSMELGLIATTVNLWDKAARQTYLQITMFLFSISTIVSPLAIIPFLMSNLNTIQSKTLHNITDHHNENVTTHIKHFTKKTYLSIVGNRTFQNNSTLPTVDLKREQSILYIGFAIAAVPVLSGAMPFACFFLSRRCSKTTSKDHHELSNDVSLLSKSDIEIKNYYKCEHELATNGDEKTIEVLLPESSENIKPTVSNCDGNLGQTRELGCNRPVAIFVFIVSCVFGALHSALEISMSDLMPTFCRNFLNWSASHAAMTVSLLYLFFTVGRMTCAFLVKLISLTKVIGIFVVFISLGSFGLSVSTNVNSAPGTWVSIGVIGLGISVCYPSQLGWTSQYLVVLTGKLTAVLLCSMYIGTVIAPPLLSFLMTMYSYLFLCYSIFVMSIMAFICVVCMGLYVYKIGNN